MQVTKKLWAGSPEGDIFLFTLSNGLIEVSVTNLGCAITAIRIPDSTGTLRNIVIGSVLIDDYLNDQFYLGAVIGRYANRIDGGHLPVGGIMYQLSVNELQNNNHLHGGFSGFNKKIFNPAGEDASLAGCAVTFGYRSVDMEEGYPGNLDVLLSYELTASNELKIGYHAETDQPTHVNLTNHTYFHLGDPEKPATSLRLTINAGRYLESNDRFLPSGISNAVDGTPFDFRVQRPIDQYWGELTTKGYNHYYFLEKDGSRKPEIVLASPDSGISVSLDTSFPGVLLYTGDYLTTPHRPNQGICLETQFPPDAPNQVSFPSTLLEPGRAFNHQTTYKFATR